MTWDGVALLDLADGPNRFKVIAQHSSSFRGWTEKELPDAISYVRLIEGAQKVIASRTTPGRFFLERWSFDALKWYKQQVPIADTLRYDSIWRIDAVGYARPKSGGPIVDAPVNAILNMPKVNWGKLMDSIGTGRVEDFEKVIGAALWAALDVDSDRIQVRRAKPVWGLKAATVDFTILDGPGASPVTLYLALERQLKTKGSAILTGKMGMYLVGATLKAVGNPILDRVDRGVQPADPSDPSDPTATKQPKKERDVQPSSNEEFFRVLLLGLCISAILFVSYYVIRLRSLLTAARTENRRLTEQQAESGSREVQVSPITTTTGYVIGNARDGQAGDGSQTEGKLTPSAPAAAFVVGNPISNSSAVDAATGAAVGVAAGGGSQLTSEQQKLSPSPVTAQSWPASADRSSSDQSADAAEAGGVQPNPNTQSM
eukprot:TRINITY_DN11239_c0_g1_i1.p1 TRINITY_DN11239_c0_g1~~TRINITY_DN11239_c0_g1_i1.p1  ORF type:complete len:430 (+),score=77.18 TRINITY_DN11239_c0_g1_i1:3-1292(+)